MKNTNLYKISPCMLVTSWSAYRFHQKECQHKMRPAEQDCTNATTENGLKNNNKPSGITLKPRQHWCGTVEGERAPIHWYSSSKNSVKECCILLNQSKSVFITETDNNTQPVSKKKETLKQDKTEQVTLTVLSCQIHHWWLHNQNPWLAVSLRRY